MSRSVATLDAKDFWLIQGNEVLAMAGLLLSFHKEENVPVHDTCQVVLST
jgi:hypothetical protein